MEKDHMTLTVNEASPFLGSALSPAPATEKARARGGAVTRLPPARWTTSSEVRSILVHRPLQGELTKIALYKAKPIILFVYFHSVVSFKQLF